MFRDGRLALLIASGGLLSITFTWLEADGLVLLPRQHPLSTTGYAWLFAIPAAATVALQIPTTRWAGRLATSRALLMGATAQAVGLAMFAAAFLGYATMVAAVLVVAIGQMIYSPAVSEFVTHRAAPGRGATYQAAMSTTEDIGTAIGPS